MANDFIFPASFDAIPETSHLQDLGDVSHVWKNIYVDNIISTGSTGGVIGPNPSNLSGIAIFGNIDGTLISNSPLFISGNSITDNSGNTINLSGTNGISITDYTNDFIAMQNGIYISDVNNDFIQMSNGNITLTDASGDFFNITNNNSNLNINQGSAGVAGFEVGAVGTILGSQFGQVAMGDLEFAGISNSPVQSGNGVIISDMNTYNFGGNADFLLMQSGNLILQDLNGDGFQLDDGTVLIGDNFNYTGFGTADTIILQSGSVFLYDNAGDSVNISNGTLTLEDVYGDMVQMYSGNGIFLTTTGIAAVNNQQIITSGIGLGSVSVTNSGNILRISGSTYSLPTNVVQSASSTGNGLAIYNSQSGSNLIFNTISGVGTNVISVSGGVLKISGTAFTLPSTASFTSLSGTTISGSTITGNIINFTTASGNNLQANIFTGTTISLTTSGSITPISSGTNSIGSANEYFGNTYTNSIYTNTQIITSTTNLASGNSNILTNQSATITLGIPVMPIGKTYNIISTVSSTTNHVIISGISCTINGATTLTLSGTIGTSAQLFSNGSNWFGISTLL